MKWSKYLPLALVYFFINSVGLPFGLTWMALLAPLFYLWMIRKGRTEMLLPFIALLLPFLVAQLMTGVVFDVYFISLLNMVFVYIFCQAFYTFLKVCPDVEGVFRPLLILNFLLCLVGILAYFTPFISLFWIQQELTTGVKDFWRFKMFTYEASYYGTLFVPLFFFYFIQYILRQNRFPGYLLVPMITLPLLLSFSMGVIGCVILSLIITTLIHFGKLIIKRRMFNLFINAGFMVCAGAAVLVFWFRNNPLFTRIMNIFTGADLSAKGRTSDSFYFAKQLLQERNEWFGVGAGQVKIMAHDMIQGYYLYNMDFVATIPNAMAEMLAIFGWVGVMLKLTIEIGLFFLTKVWTNYYRLLLFFFVFIYQFTGSFVTNIAEYIIWILAFTNVFRQFDVRPSASPVHSYQRSSPNYTGS